MHIEDYSFGKIVINGKTYTSDVIVYTDRVDPAWWRKEGHYLQEADLMDIVNAAPDILIIGTGYSGVMQVPEEIIEFLESKDIKVHVGKTGKAVELFNKQPSDKKIIGAFHLTC
ncbi:MAG: Mth938-like domain-containing protein [Nitrospirota bacterium]